MPVRPPTHRPHPRAPRANQVADQARTRDQPWRRWYWTARWRKLAKQQLVTEPLCRFCAQAGRVSAATICDHVVPHKGDEALFWRGEMQSLCKPCHDSAKQAMERGRGRVPVGLDGYPVRPNANGSRIQSGESPDL